MSVLSRSERVHLVKRLYCFVNKTHTSSKWRVFNKVCEGYDWLTIVQIECVTTPMDKGAVLMAVSKLTEDFGEKLDLILATLSSLNVKVEDLNSTVKNFEKQDLSNGN